MDLRLGAKHLYPLCYVIGLIASYECVQDPPLSCLPGSPVVSISDVC